MGDGRAIDLIWAAGALTLVASAVAARRLPLAEILRLALMWLAVFAVALLLVRLTGLDDWFYRTRVAPLAPPRHTESLT